LEHHRHLKDITQRAIEVLTEVDFGRGESRERALKLLIILRFKKPITTINTYSEESRTRSIVDQLKAAKGPPYHRRRNSCISDPETGWCGGCLAAGIDVRAIPGLQQPRALSTCGLSPDRFIFYDSSPQEGQEEEDPRRDPRGPYRSFLFESPRRVQETLTLISELGEERMVAVTGR